MQKAISLFIIIISAPAILWATEITFVIENLEHNKGGVIVGFYDAAETFPKKGKSIGGCATKGPLVNKTARVVCALNPGVYAAAIYHDENGNKKLDQNFLGIPKEGYAFSNNAKGMMGPPKFKDAVFSVEDEKKEMIIRLDY